MVDRRHGEQKQEKIKEEVEYRDALRKQLERSSSPQPCDECIGRPHLGLVTGLKEIQLKTVAHSL